MNTDVLLAIVVLILAVFWARNMRRWYLDSKNQPRHYVVGRKPDMGLVNDLGEPQGWD